MRTGLEGPVYAIAISGTDVIAAATSLARPGRSSANVARWDGADWRPLGLGASGPVLALVPVPGGVLAGGSFASMLGAAPETSRIARWDGSAWQPLGNGITGSYDEVRAIAVAGSDVYARAVRSPRSAPTVPSEERRALGRQRVARAGRGADGPVNALVMAGGELYAGGDFLSLGAVLTNRLAAWNGTAWTKVGTGADAAVRALAAPPDGHASSRGGIFTKIGGVGHPTSRSSSRPPPPTGCRRG